MTALGQDSVDVLPTRGTLQLKAKFSGNTRAIKTGVLPARGREALARRSYDCRGRLATGAVRPPLVSAAATSALSAAMLP